MKNYVETQGFYQIISDITRTWPGVEDSFLNHVWTNTPEKIVQKLNIVNTASDHNIVGITFRVRGITSSNLEFKKRKWSKFNPQTYNDKIRSINWDKMYPMTDINLAWHFFESSLNKILSEESPVVKVQPFGRYKTWVTAKTKLHMKEHDRIRAEAKLTGSADTWTAYRVMRNKVAKEVKLDRKNYFKNAYDNCDRNNDVSKLYKTAKK